MPLVPQTELPDDGVGGCVGRTVPGAQTRKMPRMPPLNCPAAKVRRR